MDLHTTDVEFPRANGECNILCVGEGTAINTREVGCNGTIMSSLAWLEARRNYLPK